MIYRENKRYNAAAWLTNEFLCIETYSGLGLVGTDDLFPAILLPPGTDDHTSGKAVSKALSTSRTLTEAQYSLFFNQEERKKKHEDKVFMLINTYRYKSRRMLFKDMRCCSIECLNGKIRFLPTHHEELEAWNDSGITKSDHVIISTHCTSSDIGAALRLGFSRCTGMCESQESKRCGTKSSMHRHTGCHGLPRHKKHIVTLPKESGPERRPHWPPDRFYTLKSALA